MIVALVWAAAVAASGYAVWREEYRMHRRRVYVWREAWMKRPLF